MKKKNEPDFYATDALVTSDEWDSFDYNLRLNIEELGRIDYDNKPLNWKKNTLAFEYLYQVEKLLLEKEQWTDDEIENIRELQALLEKYDQVKTFLLTLRMATIAYRAGLIPKLTVEGTGFLNRQSEAGKKKSPEIQRRHDQIRERFQKIHSKHPSVTPSGFAKKYADEIGLKPRQIRNILKMAVGN